MSEGKRVLIVLPDERRLELLVQPNLLSSDLLDLVTSQVALKEKEFFGLAYFDETGHYSWLQYDRRVLDHEFPKKNALPLSVHHHLQQLQPNNNHGNKCALVLYFLIKFYVESISLLRNSHTVEHFYLQLRSMVFKDQLEVGSDSVCILAAWALQAAYGDYVDDLTARNHLKKSPILPVSALKEHQSLSECEDRVIENYKTLVGHSRGQVIVNYLSKVESLPNYGVHYYSVTDKRNTPWYLGISYKGIAQYDYSDRRHPRRIFQWKQLENLYFRDRKFSIEVHDPKRVHAVHSSLYACPESPDLVEDGLTEALPEDSAQVSVNRRLQAGTISVIVWFGQTQALTKNIWHMAICQHQFYLDRRNSKARQLKARNLNDIALDLSKSSTSLSLSTASSNSQSNLSHSGSTLSLNGKMGQTPEVEESEAARAARMEIVSALKSRKSAMEEKLKAKIDELKKLCLEEGALSGQLPPEYPLNPGEALPTIRRRVGTSFTLPENLLNKAKSSKEESLAAMELEYEIQRKITSAALRLANDGSPSKAVKRQRKMIYQQSLQQLKDIETKLRSLRLAEMYNSTQAQPQVPVTTTSPWSKAKKKPRPNGGSDATLDEEAGFIQTETSLDGHDLYLDDHGVNLSPAVTQQHGTNHHNHHHHHQPLTATPMRRDRSLSPTQVPVSSSVPCSVLRSEQMPRSAPSSPQKNRHANSAMYQHQQQYTNGYSNHHHHHPHHPELRRETSGGYTPNTPMMRSSYRTKQYLTLTSSQSTPPYVIQDMSWDPHHHNGMAANRVGCPQLIGIDPSAGGGLYNIARQRASHDFPTHASMDDLEVIGLRRLTGASSDHSDQTPRSLMTSAQHSPAQDSNPNTSADFEWDFGDENAPATRRLDQLVHHRFGSLDRRRRLMNASMDADAKSCAKQVAYEGSRSMDELDGPSPLTVDVIDGSSIGPRFGNRGMRKASSSSSNQSSSYNEPELTLLPNQTYPDYPDFGASIRERSGSSSRMETVFDIDSAVYTRMSNNLSVTSLHSNKKKEKDWYETSLDSPVPGRKSKMNGTLTDKPPASLPPASTSNSSAPTPTMGNGTSTVRAQPVRLAEPGQEDSFDFETVVPFESPKNLELIAPGKFEPYREVSKPFETSDIYKYSAKYRQQQTKGLYQPLTPLACHPMNSARGGGGSHAADTNSLGENHTNPPAPEFRSKPATLV